MKTFVQIGTHNGNDEFNNLVKKENPDLVILVEPNSEMNDEIFKNYSYITDKDKLKVENTIINTKSGLCEVVIPKNPLLFPDGNYCELGTAHYSLLPLDNWGDDFKSIKVDGITFSDLCEKYSITEIDYLCIDTEGFDSQIILSINFNSVKIKKLKYEIWGFPPSEYTRYGEKGKEYGTFGMEKVKDKLSSLGYDLSYYPEDIVATLK